MKASWHVAAGVIAFAAGLAGGQVYRLPQGRALDANYGIGSMGINSIRRADPAFDGNLLITGQVTGGYQFRGGVGYVGADQLRLEMPSAGLDNFIRSSAGLERITAGGIYGPSPYYSRQQTVLGASGISQGLSAPDRSVPLATYVQPQQARRLYDAAVIPYAPILTDVGETLRVNPLLRPTLAPAQPSPSGETAPGLLAEAGPVRPAASTLFGILREQDRQRLEEELARSAAAKALEQRFGPAEPEAEAKPRAPKPPGATELPEPGENIFYDLLVEMDRIRRAAMEAPEPERPARSAETPEDSQEQTPTRQRAEQAVERVRERLVLHHLAGRSRDMFNRHMALAEKALAEGKFYKAAGHYEIAVVLNRPNPLAHLGWALALFAANEPLSSAFHLRHAMQRFPPLMETGVDVDRLLGKKVVDAQLELIEARLADRPEEPEPSLLFLAAFVRSARGQTQQAAAHAGKLRQAARDKTQRAYAELLLEGPPKPSQPTTRKAD